MRRLRHRKNRVQCTIEWSNMATRFREEDTEVQVFVNHEKALKPPNQQENHWKISNRKSDK